MDIFLGLSEIFHPDSVAVILRRDSALITKHLPVAPGPEILATSPAGLSGKLPNQALFLRHHTGVFSDCPPEAILALRPFGTLARTHRLHLFWVDKIPIQNLTMSIIHSQ